MSDTAVALRIDGRADVLSALEPESRTRLLAIVASALVVCVALGATALRAKSHDGYVAAVLVHGLIFCAAVYIAMKHSLCRRALFLILAVAVILRVLAFLVPVGLTTDGYRYVWDGRLHMAGVNPYETVPADPRLETLRDTAIYPNINGKEIYPTIYPPAAQMAFVVATRLIDGIDGMKLFIALCEVAITLALLRWLHLLRLPRERVLIYAWHPLPLWEYTSAGHIDALATALLMLAILAAWQRRQGWAGAALAGVALTKYWPAYLAAALWTRWGWRMPVAAVATAVLLYVPYVAPQIYGFGLPAVPLEKVAGSLFRHLNDEGYNQEGWGFFLAYAPRHFGLWDISGHTYARAAAAGLVALGAWVALRARPQDLQPRHLLVLAGAFLLAISPHYPWYYAILVPLLAAHMCVPLLWVTLVVSAIYIEIDYNWLTPYPRFKTYMALYGGVLLFGLLSWRHSTASRRLTA